MFKTLQQLRSLVVYLGTNVSPAAIVAAFLALGAYWSVLLWVLDEQFREASYGLFLLDLQNSLLPGQIVTPSGILQQLGSYTEASVSLYWDFFVLDGFFPLLVFATYALLWVCMWNNSDDRWSQRLLGSYVVLIPLGVQLFDWGENLFYVVAIHNYPEPGTVAAIYAGLAFKWLKAACVLFTTLATPVFVVYFLFHLGRRRLGRGGFRRTGKAVERGA